MSRRKAIDWLLRKADRLISEVDGEIIAWQALRKQAGSHVVTARHDEQLLDLMKEADDAIDQLTNVRGKLQVLE